MSTTREKRQWAPTEKGLELLASGGEVPKSKAHRGPQGAKAGEKRKEREEEEEEEEGGEGEERKKGGEDEEEEEEEGGERGCGEGRERCEMRASDSEKHAQEMGDVVCVTAPTGPAKKGASSISSKQSSVAVPVIPRSIFPPLEELFRPKGAESQAWTVFRKHSKYPHAALCLRCGSWFKHTTSATSNLNKHKENCKGTYSDYPQCRPKSSEGADQSAPVTIKDMFTNSFEKGPVVRQKRREEKLVRW